MSITRRLPNWLEAFSEYAQIYNTPDRYRTWAGVFCLAAATKRSIAMRARGNILYPNLFVLLLGGPATGKSQAVNAIKSVLTPASKFSYIPPSVTRAGLEDFMRGNINTRVGPDGRQMMSNECIGLSEEMQGILPDQDLGHLTLYNILYDLPAMHKAVTRSNGEVRLESPYCTIFTGAQPAFLATTLPEQAWGMGFMSRSIMVWGTPPPRRSAFSEAETNTKLQEDLIHDLRAIFALHGYMQWSPAAQKLYDIWWVEHGGLPIPKHKRLAMGYNGRRELHMLKLAMVMSLAQSNALIVEERHVAAAIELLLEAEQQMQHIFNEMSSTGSMVALEDVLDVVRVNTAADRDTDEGQLIQMLMQRFPATQIHSMVENLIASNALELSGGGNVRGIRKFRLGRKLGMS